MNTNNHTSNVHGQSHTHRIPTTDMGSAKDSLTQLIMQSKTKKHIHMPTTATTHISEHFEDLQSDDAFKPFSDFVNDHSTTHEINNHTHENKIHILQKFQEHVKDVLNNEQYKEWYSQQMIMGVALMEGIHPEVIQHLYNQNITINEEMQNIFQKNNVTLMDLSYNDVKFSEKDKQLFLYTMLFLHDGEEINPEQLYKSKYYTVENNNIFITEYGIKSFEQAFNCAWQIYNELFGNHELMLPHFPIKNEQEIYDLYKNKTSIESNGHTLDKEDKPLVLNITRALLHIQAHKKLDYTDNEHDPAGTIKYHEGMSWRDTYGEQINKVRDLEVKNFFASEINLLKMYDENNHLKNHRTPETYNAVSKSWLFKDIIFNNVHTTLTGRSKGLESWVMKLINDPKYKKGKSVTDSLANAFYTENQTDAMMVWLGLIEQFPDELLDQARFDVKGQYSWELLLKEFGENGKLFDEEVIRKNLAQYGLSASKANLLLKQKGFMNTIMKKLQGSSHKKHNEKTHDSYEEFKLVTTSGTEYQCIRKGNNEILSHNEYGLGNHGIYDFKKLIESRLRPNNNSMTFNYEKLSHMLDNIMEKEEQYLMTRMKQLGLLTDTNKDSFDPWKAIYYQLFYEELEGEHKDTILTHSIGTTGTITLNKEKKKSIIKGNRKNYFHDENDDAWLKDDHGALVYDTKGKKISVYKQSVKEWCYNLLQKNYTGAIATNKDNVQSYIFAKKGTNSRLLDTQLQGKKIFDQLGHQ